MTIDTNKLATARKSFLEAINNPQTATALLRNMAGELRTAQPDLFMPYIADENRDAIRPEPLHWNDQYFSQQKKVAERNFSFERLEHLLQVREHFRQEGRKGFVANAQPAPAAARSDSHTGYTPSVNLRKFVEEGDLTTLRTALIVELEDKRLDADTLRAALAWTRTRVTDLCEPYSEKAFARAIVQNREQWSADYYGLQAVYLDTNFSEERFLHLIDVREYLRRQSPISMAPDSRPVKSSSPAPARGPRLHDEQPRPSPQPPRPQPVRHRHGLSPVMLTALLIGGALAAVVILILALRK
ncbi:hypothetical protein [Janthinobacterium sp. J1-1]|uniref:hypothetical protein n=1 Tax=unclassified Janthinobacterium TaxID=2610881 RepID=UPI002810B141|nr:hypothetical protein [Janthinobacterium sp. J1-1]